LRMSLGHTTSESDIDRAISALVGVVRQLRRNKVKA
jgi:cysteine sulfinate desulfinase/cysteine desulfurase-like protein